MAGQLKIDSLPTQTEKNEIKRHRGSCLEQWICSTKLWSLEHGKPERGPLWPWNTGNQKGAHRGLGTRETRTKPTVGLEHGKPEWGPSWAWDTGNENEAHHGLGFPICSTFQAMEHGSGPQTAQLHKAEKVEGRVPDKQNTWKTQKREPKKKLQKGEEWAMVWMLTPLKIHAETSSQDAGATKGDLVTGLGLSEASGLFNHEKTVRRCHSAYQLASSLHQTPSLLPLDCRRHSLQTHERGTCRL